MQLTITKNAGELQQAIYERAISGGGVALVPTMGALHAGHISLVELAKKHAQHVVMSIFVNPTQFGPKEDFDRYPRTLEADIAMAEKAGVSILYAPDVADIYGEGIATRIDVGEIANELCGASRPGHFNGVAVVVAKLLLRTLPNVAIFGEKDYQQLCVIRQVVDDLDIPVEIIGAPTMREADGLAMSSRNRYLSEEDRRVAPKLYEILRLVGQRIVSGQEVEKAIAEGQSLLKYAGFRMEYLTLCDAETLSVQTVYEAPARLLAAGVLGSTRLIDNLEVA
ncbi:MAG: pantoate--beta-alanine ligase [Alphaproteobacteria bacterium]|nr:pantoate--beta-alanine ligase [Alphaproteobacteria bacterium]